ncbi:2-hydroxyacyl-CoA dehydratase family protein [Halanaerobacter jeridensis]|uniref:Benzoyl-CoA reductase/2-hydroxyglutaryl-CoA dehydratase subunit BcrC/BadD/HgdB n=1 Tax=Halanaerobacter jeridensis TaxID=706427 RepID=A0A939BQ96_9FIRM|nr:2-hydroxyacyl-CoA dehydratase [Halanaerobacter jeridensis]MBM7557873.1 benzoyl-CoA reductase/2-hydroxyglutaryl-CoA dehydratase subunit BcrC/BadD/HgdB [Halanaerobacter jeridensis]
MEKVGITTTIPVEVLFAVGHQPQDLNNLFITADDYAQYIELAEKDGFPKSSCAWIKGMYGACLENNINRVVSVVEGDCSDTEALNEVLQAKGIKTYPFAYPYEHDLESVQAAIDDFRELFSVSLDEVEAMRNRLNQVRALASEIDRLTWQENKATGFENHLYQINCSDFKGDIDSYEEELKNKISEIKTREPINRELRLGYIGVPPMTADIYEHVTEFSAHIVYNEVQREFTFPRYEQADNIYQQYLDYTYPYDLEFRLKEIKKEVAKRDLDGIIHYTQAFCHREIEDIIIKDELELPTLTIRGDKSRQLDSRMKLRLEAFLDMLGDMRGVN